ncbi:hypothetical protein [Corynebacterium sputi]|uniref:hypothetical protein n=1 Tax=Corynebacterium sputi TaxID=489915 RepID=UPI0012ECABC8|nr:hypothetical protein [Corynebacterium sputi]
MSSSDVSVSNMPEKNWRFSLRCDDSSCHSSFWERKIRSSHRRKEHIMLALIFEFFQTAITTITEGSL